jgi:hypothetical protein
MHKHDNCFAERRKNMKSLKLNIFAVFLLLLAPFSIVFANHGDDDEATADPFELVLGNDGVSSLPVFKGPFPETENMRFLSQIDPEDLGALEVPGVWAKGMMNDIGGWTSPNGEEYALATNSGGIAIVRVTDPENPEFLGRVESQNPFDFRNIWGDPATFGNYAYFTTEIDDSSIVMPCHRSMIPSLTCRSRPSSSLPAATTARTILSSTKSTALPMSPACT